MNKKKLKKILLILSILFLFSGITALIIIITQGGIITNRGIIDTGIIKLDIKPAKTDVTVYLNGKQVTLVDDKINNLTENTYQIRIEAEGFSAWQKDIYVVPGIVQEIEVRIYPLAFKLNQLTNTDIDKVFFSDSGEYVYYVVKDSEIGSENGIWRLRLTQNLFLFGGNQNKPFKISNIFENFKAAINQSKYVISISPDNNSILFHDIQANEYYLLNASEFNAALPAPLSEQLGYHPQNVYWFNNSRSLVVKNSDLVFEYNLASQTNTIISYSPEQPIIYAANNNQVFYYNNMQQTLFNYSKDVSKKVSLQNISLGKSVSEMHLGQDNTNFMIIKDQNGYQFLDIEKSYLKLIIADPSTKLINMSLTGTSALFVVQNEIYAFNYTELLGNNQIKTTFNKMSLKYADSEDYKYFPQATHLIYYNKNTLNISEVDGQNQIKVLDSTEIVSPYFFVDANATKLILLLSEGQTDSIANLYFVDLNQ